MSPNGHAVRHSGVVLVPDRRRRLLDAVRRAGSIEVETLSGMLAVSGSTIRRDLAELEAEGRLRRTHGGAYVERSDQAPMVAGIAGRRGSTDRADRAEAKARIGRVAASRIVDGSTVMILAGSTTGAMLPALAGRSCTVVTNGLHVANAVAAFDGISLVLVGGVLHRSQMTLLGPLAERSMADLHVQALFAGAYGIHADVGVTGEKIDQAGYHHAMLQHSDALIVLADADKLGRRGPSVLARFDQIAEIISDTAAPERQVDGLRSHGVTVTLC